MTKMKKLLLMSFFLFALTASFGQVKISGFVFDENGPLPGANVSIENSTIGASVDFDGSFNLKSTTPSGRVVISFMGFRTKKITFNVENGKVLSLGKIIMTSDANQIGEVVIKTTVIDIAKDRKTPVAVSTIKASEIQEKLGSQEFPEVLKNTPSVYATKAGGGFGDSRISIRGFDQKNIAVMINGVPVNDMENGAVFWSNWAGLSDVTSAMQVQRGLGSSKLAISSVGGTINVVTKSSDAKQGGNLSNSLGNDGYLKFQASYSTGLMKSGLSASVLLSRTAGDGYVDGTKFEGYNYFIAFGYKPNDKHDIQFSFTGAPQWHNQRFTASSIGTSLLYSQDGDPNRKYNADWGYLNGEEFNMRRNYYHKPVASINWDWAFNETSKLSTVLYGSWGRGAGSSGTGAINGSNYTNIAFRLPNGLVDFDKIEAYNSGKPVLINGVSLTRVKVNGQYQNVAGNPTGTLNTNGISRISSFNSHNWYGGIINFNKKFTPALTFDIGIDARTYSGIHYQNVNDLFGGNAFADSNNLNVPAPRVLTETYPVTASFNPFASQTVNEKIGFDNDGNVNWYGGFTQLEYSNDHLTVFVQAGVSQQAYQKVDRFLYPETIKQGANIIPNPNYNLRETSFEKILGGNVKGGINYNINEHHNVFVNAGYYSKQPFFNAVYPNFRSVLNGNLTNEKITGFEAGYGFRSNIVNVNLNAYHTTWKDRYQRTNDVSPTNVGGYIDFSGITEVHSGVELDINSRITTKLKLTAMVSVGDWKYKGNSISNTYDVTNNPVVNTTGGTLYLDNVKVGDAAQTTAAAGFSYELFRKFNIDANYNYTDKLYARINPGNFDKEVNKGSLQLPSFGLLDAGVSYKLLLSQKNRSAINFRLNMNNALDKIYIAESLSNTHILTQDDFKVPVTGVPDVTAFNAYQSTLKTYQGLDTRNIVFFGNGRTWNFTVRYEF
jgi:outer membrane cobalamin receptor